MARATARPIEYDDMPTSRSFHAADRSFRANPLALALAISAVFATVGVTAAIAETSRHLAAAASATRPSHPDTPQTWIVQNCSDGAPNSLRDIIENPANAKSGDIVDLSQLPMLCAAANSTITLTTGEITIAQDELTLLGPPPGAGTVEISGGGTSRVLKHIGNGVLSVESLKITNGYYHALGTANGGCVLQAPTGGSLYFFESLISGCTVASESGTASGGAISNSTGFVTLTRTAVTENKAHAPTSSAFGGGVDAFDLATSYASISGNIAGTGQFGMGEGGGAYFHSGVIFNTTIDNNSATVGGGVYSLGLATGYIVDSTLSENSAETSASAFSIVATTLKVWNSTVAFNRTTQSTQFAAASFSSNASGVFDLRSSIIANNTSGPANTESDLYFQPGSGTLSGMDNLVMSSNSSPQGVITSTADPMLGSLQLNGGLTKTCLPKRGSPVIGAGSNPGIPNEQRGTGYPRTTGNTTDIGSTQFDSIFYSGMD